MHKKMLRINNGIVLYGVSKNIQKKFKFGDYVYWFPKGKKTHLGKFTKKWFGQYIIQFCLPNNNMFLVTLNKFDPNLVFINVNKLKPCQFLNEEAYTIDRPKPIYLERQKDTNVDNKDQYYHEKLVSTVQIAHIDEKSKTQGETFSMIMDVDDSCLDLMPNGNKRHNGSYFKTLKGKTINEGRGNQWRQLGLMTFMNNHFFLLLPIFMNFNMSK